MKLQSMKILSFVVFILFGNFSYSQTTTKFVLNKDEELILFQNLGKTQYQRCGVQMGYLSGIGIVDFGYWGAKRLNEFGYWIKVGGRVDQNTGLMRNVTIEAKDKEFNEILIRIQWLNLRKDNGTYNGEIQINFNRKDSSKFQSYFVGDNWNISFKVDFHNNKQINRIIENKFSNNLSSSDQNQTPNYSNWNSFFQEFKTAIIKDIESKFLLLSNNTLRNIPAKKWLESAKEGRISDFLMLRDYINKVKVQTEGPNKKIIDLKNESGFYLEFRLTNNGWKLFDIVYNND